MKFNNKQLVEIVGFLGVVMSLVFVGLELRQSTIASRAEAYQELGIATSNLLMNSLAVDGLRVVLNKAGAGEESIQSMTEEELWKATQWAQATLRVFETVYLQVELGQLEPEALDYLGWEGYLQFPWLKNLWPRINPMLSRPFREYVESEWEQD